MLKSFDIPRKDFPLPSSLPTDLTELRNDDSLMYDVWTDSNTVDLKNQAWLIDPKLREGIRFYHDMNRSVEEYRRLGREAENLLRFYSLELRALEITLRSETGMFWFIF